MPETAYQSVLIKLSGEALAAAGERGVTPEAVETIARELKPAVDAGVRVGLVVGAGNFVRGRMLADAEHIHPTTADYMGMLATVMNALALRDTLIGCGMPAVVMSAIRMDLVCETYSRVRLVEHLDAGRVVIFAGGTSHPGVTTDMCAAIRANEMQAEVLIKATKVDGVYTADPARDSAATKYDRLTAEQAIAERLGVMDLPAMAFCMERKIPILVMDFFQPGNLHRAVTGQTLGTLVDA